MRRTIANLILLFAFASTATAADVPRGLARWLLAAGGTTQPLPLVVPPALDAFPGPPEVASEVTDADIDQLFATRESLSSASTFPAPPAAPRDGVSRWTGEYANQVAAPDQRPVRLPSPPDFDADRVRFAGGAIEFAVPMDWVVAEADLPRQVRLYVTPTPLPVGRNVMTDGVWISYHAEAPMGKVENRLRTAMAKRLAASLPENENVGAQQFTRVAEHVAIRAEFEVDAHGNEAGPAGRGFHELIATDWGFVEVHARYTSSETLDQIERLITGLKIGEPAVADVAFTSAAAQAKPIVGSWKAEQARLVLSADGTVELIHDRPRRRRLDANTLVRPERQLQGHYAAQGDLLFVTWADGSQLNLRWASTDGELLLTDHLGRVSQLARLFE